MKIQFWGMNPHCLKDNFHSSNYLKTNFYTTKKVDDGGKVVPTLLSIHNLDTTLICRFFFKMMMVHNFETMCKENELNLVTRLWHKIFDLPFSTISI
jgi:hypothetical protein